MNAQQKLVCQTGVALMLSGLCGFGTMLTLLNGQSLLAASIHFLAGLGTFCYIYWPNLKRDWRVEMKTVWLFVSLLFGSLGLLGRALYMGSKVSEVEEK